MMRIGFDIRPLLDPQPSGVGVYTAELLRAILRIDEENHYHLFSNSFQKSAVCRLPSIENKKVTAHAFHYPNKFFNTSLRFLKHPNIDELISKKLPVTDYQLPITNQLDLFFMPNLNFVSLNPQTPLVIMAHDLSFDWYPSFFTLKECLWHRLVNPGALWNRARHIIAASEHTRTDIMNRYGISPDRITTIYQGVSDLFFEPISQEKLHAFQTAYQLPRHFILFLGTLEPRKNLPTLFAAFAKLRTDPRFHGYYLVLAGKIQRRHPTPSHVIPLGYVDDGDRPLLYRLAEIMIYPSYYEGFGLPPLEAMACGTPVIASHASSVSEIVDDAGLLINPHAPEDLHQALRALLTSPTLKEIYRERGIQKASSFRWENAAWQTLNIFRKVAIQKQSA